MTQDEKFGRAMARAAIQWSDKTRQPISFQLKIRERIQSAMRPHTCTYDGCGQVPNERHQGCVEIDSDVFSEACKDTPELEFVTLPPH